MPARGDEVEALSSALGDLAESVDLGEVARALKGPSEEAKAAKARAAISSGVLKTYTDALTGVVFVFLARGRLTPR